MTRADADVPGTGSLHGRRVIVTGGASGIGRATTLDLAASGARVAVIDVDETAARGLVGAAGGHAPAMTYFQADVASEQETARAVGSAVAALGGVDVLVTAAGIMRGQLLPIAEFDEATWDRVVDVNLKGAFNAAKHAASPMLEAGRGVIILVGSRAGVASGSGSYAYGASKGGVHGLAMTLDRLLGPRGIRVNDVCPGDVDTPLYRRSLREGIEHGGDAAAADEMLARTTAPEAVARVIAFLASDAASAVRGTVLTA